MFKLSKLLAFFVFLHLALSVNLMDNEEATPETVGPQADPYRPTTDGAAQTSSYEYVDPTSSEQGSLQYIDAAPEQLAGSGEIEEPEIIILSIK